MSVAYADFAYGKFIADAASRSFYDNTLFVFVADHGARVYGSEQVPLDSYRIPVLFYWAGADSSDVHRSNRMGSQMDVGPTILDFMNMDYNSEFFGCSLFDSLSHPARALLSHNRDVALLRGDSMSVLGINRDDELWIRNPQTGRYELTRSAGDYSLRADAIAYYQTAYDLFESRRLGSVRQTQSTDSALVTK